MDWFDHLGNMASLFPTAPGLAFDMALNGADPDWVGYGLAYGLQVVPEPIDVYPPQEMPLSGPMEA